MTHEGSGAGEEDPEIRKGEQQNNRNEESLTRSSLEDGTGWSASKAQLDRFKAQLSKKVADEIGDRLGRLFMQSIDSGKEFPLEMSELEEWKRLDANSSMLTPKEQELFKELQDRLQNASYAPSPEWLLRITKSPPKVWAETVEFPTLMRNAFSRDEWFVRTTGNERLQGPSKAGPETVGSFDADTEAKFRQILRDKFPEGFPKDLE